MSLVHIRRRVVLVVLAVVAVTMVATAHNPELAPVLSKMKAYADRTPLNNLFGLSEPRGLAPRPEDDDEDLEDRVLRYLGDLTRLDPLEERPLNRVDDPDQDLRKGKANNGGKAKPDQTGAGDGAGASPAAKADDLVEVPAKTYPEVPAPGAFEPFSFRVYSHNVKNGAHEKLVAGELPWLQRKDMVIGLIKYHAVPNTIVFLQEPVATQIYDVMQALNLLLPADDLEWVYYGGGRIDGRAKGEHVPVIVRRKEWEVVYDDTTWLNELNPRKNYVGWDAKYPRIATFLTLKHRASGAYLNVVNTHFDHKGETARAELARLLIDRMAGVNEWPLLLLGDLNATPKDAGYKRLAKAYADVHNLIPKYGRYGHPDYTVTGFSGRYLRDAKRIDYIFAPKYTQKVSDKTCQAVEPPKKETKAAKDKAAKDKTAKEKAAKDKPVKEKAAKADSKPKKEQKQKRQTPPFYFQLTQYAVLHSKFGGVYMSDHRPLVADFHMGSCV